jgi:hypothetical protein
MNRGKLAIPSYLAALTDALGEPIAQNALASLTGYGLASGMFQERVSGCYREGSTQLPEVLLCRRTGTGLPNGGVPRGPSVDRSRIFDHEREHRLRAVRLRVATLLSHAASIISLDGDSLSALSLNGKEGLLIDHNADDPVHRYEVTIWGERWPIVAVACEAL